MSMDFVENLGEIPPPGKPGKPARGQGKLGVRRSEGRSRRTRRGSQGKAGKIFRHEVHLLHLELLSVQRSQRPGVGSEAELQPVGVQGLIAAAVALVLPLAAIFAVSQQGVPAAANWARIWWVRPVMSWQRTRESPVPDGQGLVQCDGRLGPPAWDGCSR